MIWLISLKNQRHVEKTYTNTQITTVMCLSELKLVVCSRKAITSNYSMLKIRGKRNALTYCLKAVRVTA